MNCMITNPRLSFRLSIIWFLVAFEKKDARGNKMGEEGKMHRDDGDGKGNIILNQQKYFLFSFLLEGRDRETIFVFKKSFDHKRNDY